MNDKEGQRHWKDRKSGTMLHVFTQKAVSFFAGFPKNV